MYNRIHHLLQKFPETPLSCSLTQQLWLKTRGFAVDNLEASKLLLIFPVALFTILAVHADELAVYGEPLKEEYSVVGEQFTAFYRTNRTGDVYSLICNAGQAIPNPQREGWDEYEPVADIKLELQARLAVEARGGVMPLGFAVFSKEGEVLEVLQPDGGYKDSVWDGNAFISWSETDSEVRIRSADGQEGYAYIDLVDGEGLFYKNRKDDTPKYFLKDCRSIKEEDLPVYDWR